MVIWEPSKESPPTLKRLKRTQCHRDFFKPRPVPCALKEKTAEELRRLEKIGVLQKVEFSDWAKPIVPVLKPDGSVRICEDYNITINPALVLLDEESRQAAQNYQCTSWFVPLHPPALWCCLKS